MKVSSTPAEGFAVRHALGAAALFTAFMKKDNVKRNKRGDYEQMVVES
jgi:hypothetical protein